MTRDILRAALAVLVMSVAAGILIETRYHLAAIDVAHRAATGQQIAQHQPAQLEQPSRLRQLGKASLNLADAAIGVFR
jgi:hypothetical protein